MSSNNVDHRRFGPRSLDRSWSSDFSIGMSMPNLNKNPLHPFIHDYMFSKVHYRADIIKMIKLAKLQPHEVVLDLGTGFGWAISAAAPQCRFVVGVDNNQLHIDQAAKYNKHVPNHSLHCLDIGSGPEAFRELQLKVAKHLDPSSSTPARFDVVVVDRTLRKFREIERRRILCMIREHLLTPYGRVVLVEEPPNSAVRTIEIVYGLEEGGHVKTWDFWGRLFVGNDRALRSIEQDLQVRAGGCGYLVESSHAFTDVQLEDYFDISKKILDAAKATKPALGFASDTMLEDACQQRMRELHFDFWSRQKVTDSYFKDLHAAVRSKRAAVIGILKPQA